MNGEKVCAKGTCYRVTANSYLGLGVQEFRHRYLRNLVNEAIESKLLLDPCYPQFFVQNFDEFSIAGTGDYPKCKENVKRLLVETFPSVNLHYVGISEIWNTLSDILHYPLNEPYSSVKLRSLFDFLLWQQNVE